MTVRNILTYPNPALNSPAEPVLPTEENTSQLAQDLIDTLSATTGVGLAAPQIGVNKRVIVYDHRRVDDKAEYRVLLNPRITNRTGEQISQQEGCKSLPGLRMNLLRAESIEVKGQDNAGNTVRVSASGFEAVVLQHEIDHLDGILIIDHVADPDKERYQWYATNIGRIVRKLDWLSHEPEGVIYRRTTSNQNIIIVKDSTQIQLYFVSPGRLEQQPEVSGIMSRIDIEDPLRLLGVYTQAMMLSLLWQEAPQYIHMLGFGGGRIPMIFHHYLPEVVIEGTEIDPLVVNLATKYFGISYDDRLKATVSDGREYLSKLANTMKYDIILIDCFTGAGHHPYVLSTREFYDLCLVHLTETGVIAVNLLESDPMFSDKAWTFRTEFKHVYDFTHEGAHVFFGTNCEVVPKSTLLERGKALTMRYQFRFPFQERLHNLVLLPPALKSSMFEEKVLTDKLLQEHTAVISLDREPSFHNVGRNDECPCGSGKKFKHCHGKR